MHSQITSIIVTACVNIEFKSCEYDRVNDKILAQDFSLIFFVSFFS